MINFNKGSKSNEITSLEGSTFLSMASQVGDERYNLAADTSGFFAQLETEHSSDLMRLMKHDRGANILSNIALQLGVDQAKNFLQRIEIAYLENDSIDPETKQKTIEEITGYLNGDPGWPPPPEVVEMFSDPSFQKNMWDIAFNEVKGGPYSPGVTIVYDSPAALVDHTLQTGDVQDFTAMHGMSSAVRSPVAQEELASSLLYSYDQAWEKDAPWEAEKVGLMISLYATAHPEALQDKPALRERMHDVAAAYPLDHEGECKGVPSQLQKNFQKDFEQAHLNDMSTRPGAYKDVQAANNVISSKPEATITSSAPTMTQQASGFN